MPTVCILAGGLGTRLGEIVRSTPKPLIEVAGSPFLLHQLSLLAHYGVRRVVLCVGYLGELVEERIGERRFGIDIVYSYDAPGLDGTLGAIRRTSHLLGDRFLFLYGDTYLRIDYSAVAADWARIGRPALMTVLRNAGRWDTSNAIVRDGMVVAYDKRHPTSAMEWIDYGLGGLCASCLDEVGPEATDLADLLSHLASSGELQAFEASERFYEIGTPEALEETDRVLAPLADAPGGAPAGAPVPFDAP